MMSDVGLLHHELQTLPDIRCLLLECQVLLTGLQKMCFGLCWLAPSICTPCMYCQDVTFWPSMSIAHLLTLVAQLCCVLAPAVHTHAVHAFSGHATLTPLHEQCKLAYSDDSAFLSAVKAVPMSQILWLVKCAACI